MATAKQVLTESNRGTTTMSAIKAFAVLHGLSISADLRHMLVLIAVVVSNVVNSAKKIFKTLQNVIKSIN